MINDHHMHYDNFTFHDIVVIYMSYYSIKATQQISKLFIRLHWLVYV